MKIGEHYISNGLLHCINKASTGVIITAIDDNYVYLQRINPCYINHPDRDFKLTINKSNPKKINQWQDSSWILFKEVI